MQEVSKIKRLVMVVEEDEQVDSMLELSGDELSEEQKKDIEWLKEK